MSQGGGGAEKKVYSWDKRRADPKDFQAIGLGEGDVVVKKKGYVDEKETMMMTMMMMMKTLSFD